VGVERLEARSSHLHGSTFDQRQGRLLLAGHHDIVRAEIPKSLEPGDQLRVGVPLGIAVLHQPIGGDLQQANALGEHLPQVLSRQVGHRRGLILSQVGR
jgi:hypothetical protein